MDHRVGTKHASDPSGDRRDFAARRDAERVRRVLQTSLVLDDGEAVACVVQDISASGAGLACLTNVVAGAKVELDLPGIGAAAGDVAWVSGVRIGVRFDEPIDPAVTAAGPTATKPIDRRDPK